MPQFKQHPLRETLSNEIHARPPVPLNAPECVSYLAFVHENGSAAQEAAHLQALAELYGLPAPDLSSGHLLIDTGEFRLKWERHNEFSSYGFMRRLESADSDTPSAEQNGATSALLHVPTSWRKEIPGQLIAATHIELRSAHEVSPERVMQQLSPQGNAAVNTQVADGAGWVFTDFQLRDGFSHFLVIDAGLTPRQAGRTAQRLLEIETYRVMALLAFPVAKEVGRLLLRAEDELADIMDGLTQVRSPDEDRRMLGRLTRLAAEVERSVARSTFRFGAAAAYYGMVQQRVAELREVRQAGSPTIGEFMERRLAPAINTCATMARRQDDLSGRIARNSQLLRTRVDIELERQNQELLAQMNRRAKIQLHLQETVEGLSVVAITYYASQLVNYVAKGATEYIAPATPEVITAVSIPVIAGLVYMGLRKMRKVLAKEDGDEGA